MRYSYDITPGRESVACEVWCAITGRTVALRRFPKNERRARIEAWGQHQVTVRAERPY